MDKIREEFEKIADEIIAYILFQNCKGKDFYKKRVTNILLKNYKSRDEEIKKFRDALDTVINNVNVNQRGVAMEITGDIDIGYLIALKDGK